MLTQAPLPTWVNLSRALLHRPPSDTTLTALWHREGEVAGWLSRSAWSLALIALWRKSRTPASSVIVWIPDFFCNSALTALRRTGASLVFYPLTDKMAPDIKVCRTLADTGPPDLFILVHYFGQPAPVAAARDFCMHYGTWLVEDAAHVLGPVDGIGVYSDFVLYSPHKHLPIPDGAVLVVRTNGPGQLGTDGLASFGMPSSWPGRLREWQKELGCSGNSVRTHTTVWLIKRVLQKLGVRLRHRSIIPFTEPSNPDPGVFTQYTSPSQSGLARRLLASLLSDLGAVARKRHRLQLLWDKLLIDDLCPDDLSATARPLYREWTPYLAAYKVDPARAEAIYNQWQCQCMPVTTWPDLPPEVTMQRNHYSNAWRLRHNQIYLPVHQSLSERGLLEQCRWARVIPESETQFRLAWDNATREQWNQWMVQAGRSNILQSWPYGEAKSVNEGWQVKRGVFYCDEEAIALVQVLQKPVAGLFGVTRINRGPLCLKPLLPQEQYVLWKELARLGCLWRGQLLSVAPELELAGSSLALIGDIGFRQFSSDSWESVWLELELGLDELRKRLNGKWRNMLTVSEKTSLKLEIGSDDQLFNWMMIQYRHLVQEKNFSGPPIEFLLTLRKQLDDEEQFLILRAVHEGEPVAGICIARHGIAATYLLGWNGNKGRNLKANQYLLWQAIIHLKQSGFSWFDLGGISQEQTPGITSFKLGLNGQRYSLVGEYWKW